MQHREAANFALPDTAGKREHYTAGAFRYGLFENGEFMTEGKGWFYNPRFRDYADGGVLNGRAVWAPRRSAAPRTPRSAGGAVAGGDRSGAQVLPARRRWRRLRQANRGRATATGATPANTPTCCSACWPHAKSRPTSRSAWIPPRQPRRCAGSACSHWMRWWTWNRRTRSGRSTPTSMRWPSPRWREGATVLPR